ncbi:MAG: YicC family protein [Magnetococcus sp. WYHC-3]
MSGTVSSMTGFAQIEETAQGYRLSWRVKSVNHRFLDLALRLPDEVGGWEAQVRERVKARLARGRVECQFSLAREGGGGSDLVLDKALLGALLDMERRLRDGANTNWEPRSPLSMDRLMSWPGLIAERRGLEDEPVPLAERLAPMAMEMLQRTLERLVVEREREGAGLARVLLAGLDSLESQAAQVSAQLPLARAEVERRLAERVRELEVEVDPVRMAQEVAFLLNRADVGEELDRLRLHVDEMRQVLLAGGAAGRRLDFLCQELNREANTLCSKSQDRDISRIGVDMKVTIEQLREQVQNLE